MMNHTIFYILHDILKTACGLELHYIPVLNGTLTSLDRGLRTFLSNKEPIYQDLENIIKKELSFGSILYFQDSFSINYIIFSAHPDNRAFCAISPFMTEPVQPAVLSQLQELNQLTNTQLEHIMGFLETLPVIALPNALSISKRILTSAYNESTTFQFKNLGALHSSNKTNNIFSDELEEPQHSTRFILEDIYQHELFICQFAVNGDYLNALKEYHLLMKLHQQLPTYEKSNYSNILIWANSLYRKTAQDNGIPFNLIHDLFVEYNKKILNCQSYSRYTTLQMQMLNAYYNLCQEYLIQKYSNPIRQTIAFIHQNLGNTLTLEIIAQNVGFSRTYITHRFKKEVGITPMQYILNKRIEIAKQLLISTNRSIQNIANSVGITDWSYFSKLFKENVGTTPTEYRHLTRKTHLSEEHI